jgi:hypothetical protein
MTGSLSHTAVHRLDRVRRRDPGVARGSSSRRRNQDESRTRTRGEAISSYRQDDSYNSRGYARIFAAPLRPRSSASRLANGRTDESSVRVWSERASARSRMLLPEGKRGARDRRLHVSHASPGHARVTGVSGSVRPWLTKEGSLSEGRSLYPDAGRVLDDVGFFELAFEPADRDADGVGEWVGVLVPGLLEQSFCAERAGAGVEQRFEDGELFGRQVELCGLRGWRSGRAGQARFLPQ